MQLIRKGLVRGLRVGVLAMSDREILAELLTGLVIVLSPFIMVWGVALVLVITGR